MHHHENGSYYGDFTLQESEGGGGNPMFGSFFFKKKIERIDWKKLACVDLDRIIHQLDFRALQDNLISVAFCDIESELDTRHTDPNFLKLFKLSQLIIEYLLHSQDYLTNAVAALESKLNSSTEDVVTVKRTITQKSHELVELKKECHKRKKLLLAQQQIMDSGPQSYHKCSFCSKAFLNASFLQAHIYRRHDGVPPRSASPTRVTTHTSVKSSTVVNKSLELELRELVNRLRTREGQADLERGQLDLSNLHAWKDELLEQHRLEIEQLKEMFLREIKELNERYLASERKLQEVKLRQAHKGRSNIGNIEDDEVDAQRKIRSAGRKSPEKSAASQAQEEELRMKEAEIARLKALNRSRQQQMENQRARNSPKEVIEDTVQIKRSAGVASGRPTTDESLGSSQRRVQIQEHPVRKSHHDSEEESDSQREMSVALGNILKEPPFVGDASLNASLDASLLRSSRLLDELRADPESLKALKESLRLLLEEHLNERGIKPGSRGITNPVLNDKLALLRRERDQLSRKHIKFLDIRQALARKVDRLARERYYGPGRAHMDRADHGPHSYSQTPSLHRPRQAPRREDINSDNVTVQAERGRYLHSSLPARSTGPKPPPRDIEPSSESESEESPSGRPDRTRPSPSSRSEHSGGAVPSPRKPRQRSATNSSGTSPNVSPPGHRADLDHQAEWDYPDGRVGTGSLEMKGAGARVDAGDSDISDILEELGLELSSPKAGTKVSGTSKSLEEKLRTRGDKGKPFGGVNVGTPDVVVTGDDEELSRISSLNDEESRGHDAPAALGSRNGLRAAASLDFSNTYGTSEWGTGGSRAVSTVNPGATQKSMATNKSSEIGGDDLDSDPEA